MKIAVTKHNAVQVGMDYWKDVFETKSFDDSTTIKEIMEWSGKKRISELNFSEFME